MRKFKKLLAAATALALSASAFAGLAIPVSADGGATATFTITAPGEATTAVALKPTYTNGVLTALSTEPVNIAAGQTTVEVTADEGAKVMLWSSLSGTDAMKPLAPAATAEAATPPVETGEIYINENFNGTEYTSGTTIITSTGDNVVPDSVTIGNLIYSAGTRNGGIARDGVTPNISAVTDGNTGNAIQIQTNGFCNEGRTVKFSFAENAGVPAFADVTNGEVLALEFDVKANAEGVILIGNSGFVKIGTNYRGINANTWTHVKVIFDSTNSKQTIIVTDSDGKILETQTSDLTGTSIDEIWFGNEIVSTILMDNLTVKSEASTLGLVTMSATDGENAPLSGVTVAVGSKNATAITDSDPTFTVGDDGALSLYLPAGTYQMFAKKDGYEHTTDQKDPDSQSVTVTAGGTAQVNFTLSQMSYIKVPDTVTITGGQVFVAAPKAGDPSTTEAFTVEVIDQENVPMTSDEYSTTWSIFPAGSDTEDENVTIDENGVVSVDQGFYTSASNGIAAYDVTVVAATDDRNQKVTKTLMIGNNDISYYEAIGWLASGRTSSTNFASSTTLQDISEVTLDMTFAALGTNRTNSQRSWALVTDAGNLVGLQYRAETNSIVAWTGWTGSGDLNQSSDNAAYTNSFTLLSSYTAGTKISVTFVIDTDSKAITISCGDVTQQLTYTLSPTKVTGMKAGMYDSNADLTVHNVIIREPDNNYLSINGDADFAKISGQTITKTYTLGQSVIVSGETFTWEVLQGETVISTSDEESSTSAVTINADGVLSVTDEATAGTYTIRATSDINEKKTATLDVEIGNFQTFTNAKSTVSGPQAYNLGTDTTGTYTVDALIDSYGDDEAGLVPAATWTSSNAEVATITTDGTLTVVGAGTATVTATITNGTATSTLTVPITVAKYYISADATGNSTTIDSTGLITSDHITGYQVALSNNNEKVSVTTVDTVPATVDTTGADKVEIAPIFEFAAGAPGEFNTVGEGYDIAIPADTYNFTVTDTGDRCDVYANKQMLVNNILQGANTINHLDVNDIVINEGVAKISTTDYSSGSDKTKVNITVKVVKSPSNITRVRKMYVLGDSLFCIYYNGGSKDNGSYQTGVGQVLQDYLTDDIEVVDLANSGATANGLYGTAFSQVLASGQKGDILLLESGYNDRTYDTEEVMKNAVTQMYNQSVAKELDVVLVSPNASQHDYKADVAWTSKMTALATELNAKYINLAELSYNFLYGIYGTNTDAVKATYNVSDGLHSTYNGAQKWASIVAGKLIDLGYTSIVDTTNEYTFTDSLNNTITCQAVATAAE